MEYLDQLEGVGTLDKDHLMKRMKDIMIDCHLAASANLDSKRRAGYKLEIIGFDFLIDEDLRVWLIEVNTCPFLGPVLTIEQPNFMLDLVDDTFKITIDKLFFDRTLSPEEIEKETMYELLCNHDGSFSKRSMLGLERSAESSLKLESTITPKKELKRAEEMWEVVFNTGMYPSKEIHEQLIASQKQSLDKFNKAKHDEAALRAKQAKL